MHRLAPANLLTCYLAGLLPYFAQPNPSVPLPVSMVRLTVHVAKSISATSLLPIARNVCRSSIGPHQHLLRTLAHVHGARQRHRLQVDHVHFVLFR